MLANLLVIKQTTICVVFDRTLCNVPLSLISPCLCSYWFIYVCMNGSRNSNSDSDSESNSNKISSCNGDSNSNGNSNSNSNSLFVLLRLVVLVRGGDIAVSFFRCESSSR